MIVFTLVLDASTIFEISVLVKGSRSKAFLILAISSGLVSGFLEPSLFVVFFFLGCDIMICATRLAKIDEDISS